MPRLFLSHERISSSSSVILSSEEVYHLRVMRLKADDIISITDGYGCRYKAKIIEIGRKRAVVKILCKENLLKKTHPEIILGQAVPRFAKMEFILQKATELGINCICPIKTERAFISKNKTLSQNRWQRWRRILIESAKQSGRIDLPILTPPQDLDSFLEEGLATDFKICLWEDEDKDENLKDIFRRGKKPESIFILIGPEGGFSSKEIRKIKESGYQSLLCGPRIMRVETAALTFIALCQYEWGDI